MYIFVMLNVKLCKILYLFSESLKISFIMSDPVTKLLDSIERLKAEIKLKDVLISEMYLQHVEVKKLSIAMGFVHGFISGS